MWIAIEYSYKLGQKSEFKFWCELGWFLQRQSQITLVTLNVQEETVCSIVKLSWTREIFDCGFEFV